MRRFLSVGLVALLVGAAPAPAPKLPKAGTYEVAIMAAPGIELVYGLIKITPKDDGTVETELVAASPRSPNLSLGNATLKGDILRIEMKNGSTKMTFEGKVSHSGAEKLRGTMGDDSRPTPATLTLTEKTSIAANQTIRRASSPPPMQKALELSSKVSRLRLRAQRANDADEKAKLLAEASDAEKEAEAETPKLYQETIDKYPDDPAAEGAAMNLLRGAGKAKADPATVGKWAAAAIKAIEPFGPRYEINTDCQIASALLPQSKYVSVALEYAERAEKHLKPSSPLAMTEHVLSTLARVQKKAGMSDAHRDTLTRLGKAELAAAQKDEKALTANSPSDKQENVLSALASAQRKLGMASEAKDTETRLAKVAKAADAAYLAKMPPFKPETYSGRKEKSDRVVVMELFTGAQCPPCVAADVGFDALEKTYKPTDVVFLQYHLHIPGPDPLTNPTTEARAKHYDVHSTPTTLFDGKKEAGGGGPVGNAEKKYSEYREIIDKLLEEPAKATLAVSAVRHGETIDIHAKVSDLAKPGNKMRLRLAVVEESIRYVGGNKLRFHHMVVRTMPGGVDGFKLTSKQSEHDATVDLAHLRQALSDYLDEHEAINPFPKPDRPLALKNLKVIAFVQNDANGNILQAAVADLGSEHAAK